VALPNAVERHAIMRMLQVNHGKPRELDRKSSADIVRSTTDITGSLRYPVQSVKDNSSVTAIRLVSRPFNEQSTGGFFWRLVHGRFYQAVAEYSIKKHWPRCRSLLGANLTGKARGIVIRLNYKNYSHRVPWQITLSTVIFPRSMFCYPFVHKEAFLAAYDSLWRNKDSPSTRSTNGLGLGDARGDRTTFYYGLNVIFASGVSFLILFSMNERPYPRPSSTPANQL
jgi:hypothetical protein